MDVLNGGTAMRPIACLMLALAGCASMSGGPAVRAYRPPPPPNFHCAELPFSDSDGFDAALKAMLNDGVPAIRVALDADGTDWPDRLVGWIDAYRAGGKLEQPAGKGGLAALAWLAAGGGLSAEARKAVESAIEKLDESARRAAAFVAAVRDRGERVELLRPYRLTFEPDAARGGKFTLLLFNGRYPG